jgi:hypothetical protein
LLDDVTTGMAISNMKKNYGFAPGPQQSLLSNDKSKCQKEFKYQIMVLINLRRYLFEILKLALSDCAHFSKI